MAQIMKELLIMALIYKASAWVVEWFIAASHD